MGPIGSSQLARYTRPSLQRGVCRFLATMGFCLITTAPIVTLGQLVSRQPASGEVASVGPVEAHVVRTRRFLGGRTRAGGVAAARAMDTARQQHAAMRAQQAALPQLSSLSAAWQPIGPNRSRASPTVMSQAASRRLRLTRPTWSGNTVYVGTTGGGVWKSTNAAGLAASVAFTPLTDTLSGFNANAGNSAIPSLSIGAISVQSGVVLAGTGDPNDASDSFYGSGLLRSADGGLTWTLIQDSQGWSGRQSLVQRAWLCRICLEQCGAGYRGRRCFSGR